MALCLTFGQTTRRAVPFRLSPHFCVAARCGIEDDEPAAPPDSCLVGSFSEYGNSSLSASLSRGQVPCLSRGRFRGDQVAALNYPLKIALELLCAVTALPVPMGPDGEVSLSAKPLARLFPR
jgi:hypothetical protein